MREGTFVGHYFDGLVVDIGFLAGKFFFFFFKFTVLQN
jgi:hypothetical protein